MMKKYEVPITILLSIVSLAAALALVFGWKPSWAQASPGVVKISAMSLLDEYDKNSWAAGQKYKDVTLVVTGRVASIDNRGFRMLLGSHQEFRILKAGMAQRVSAADFPPGEDHVFPTNRRATLVCKSGGYSYGYPILKGCVEVDE